MGEGKGTSSTEFFLSTNLLPIIFFAGLTFAAWKLCEKAGVDPKLSILVFVMAIINQGLGLLAFVGVCIFAGLKIIEAKKQNNNRGLHN